jgi:predicted nucleic acid-binding protein
MGRTKAHHFAPAIGGAAGPGAAGVRRRSGSQALADDELERELDLAFQVDTLPPTFEDTAVCRRTRRAAHRPRRHAADAAAAGPAIAAGAAPGRSRGR